MSDPEPDPNRDREPNAESTEQPLFGSPRELLPYAAAGVLLGLNPDAVRMRCRRGTLVCQAVGNRRLVFWPQPEPEPEPEQTEPGSDRTGVRSVRSGATDPNAVGLAARLAAVEREREQWQHAHAELQRQHGLVLELLAATNAALEGERSRTAALESRVSRLAAVAERTEPDRTRRRPCDAFRAPWRSAISCGG